MHVDDRPPRGTPRTPWIALGAVAWSLAAGCAVGPNFAKPEVPVSAGWRTTGDPHLAAQIAADSTWWKTFNDPALNQLIELAYRQNLPLQVAGLRIVESRAQMAVTTGRIWPQVQVATGSATAVGLSRNALGLGSLPIPRNFGDFQIGFDAAWELDFWGKYRRGIESARASVLGTMADYESALVSLTAEVARAYVSVRTFEVLIQEAQDNAKVQEEALKIAESRFTNGATSELDVTQARSLLESTHATIPQLQASLQQAQNALATLLGRPTGTVDALLAGPKQIPRAPDKVAIGVPAEMLRRRPDIRSAELMAAAQCARIGVAKAELYPSFTLVGSVGVETTASSAGTKNLFSSNSLYYNFGPHITFPFLNYGRLTNAVRVEDARLQELLVAYRDAVLKAAQEVEDSLIGFVNAQQAVVFEQAAVTAAQRSVEISLVQYREGATDYQRVLESQRSLLEQENGLTQVTSSVATNVIALYKALGGGWEVREGQPIVPDAVQQEMRGRTNWGDMLPQH
jgi:NodT family efflux transporter outer membrane factor (OMF) lipoprotein